MGVWKLVHSFCIYFAAYYLLRSIIVWSTGTATTQPLALGYAWNLGLFGAAVVQTYALMRMNSGLASISLSVKSAMSTLVYRKMMRLKGTEGVGKSVDLIGRDCDRVVDGLLYFHYLWCAFPECIST